MKTVPAWRRWLLLCALFTLGLLYIAAFRAFRHDSRNFLDAVEDARARAYAERHPLRTLPQRLVFNHGNPEAGYLAGGWWPPAHDGATLVHTPARLLLPLAPPRRAVRIDFTLDAYVPAPGATVTLTSRGRELALWKVGDTPRLKDASVVVAAADQRDGFLEFELHLYGPRKAWKGSRAAVTGAEIALLLRELTISAVEPAAP
ncbi:MAG TPA: hypothetical protein VLF18_19385 [Tahibacter sp.]|uniref:hypothetical protein n=1 Tax=Tahibacter sp. TaxID=2056211 RepID=UPI002BAE5914|nr:hypothetical protein [Tahibacter sp.]HSX62353.1 hypothetical protein [Tahibacter sp.]